MAHLLPNEVANIAKMGLSHQANTSSEEMEKVVSQDAGVLKQGCFGFGFSLFNFFEKGFSV